MEYRSRVRLVKGERGSWQRRFWEYTIRDEYDYASHMDYVHINPPEAWFSGTGGRLAVFDLSSLCGLGAVSGGLGG